MIYFHLGYPIGWHVSNVKIVGCIYGQIANKFNVLENTSMVITSACETKSGSINHDSYGIILFTISTKV